MASISGVNSSNANSLYGSRNVLSGLATGMDTETMIENAVSGYKTKINSLLQRQAKFSWQQTAYRNITDPMVQFARKYASYTSATNLLSGSFFSGAVKTASNGANADRISAAGKTNSDVRILGVKQLATKSTYNVSAAKLGLSGGTDLATILGKEKLDLEEAQELSNVSGSLTFGYGGANRQISIDFGDKEIYKTADEFVAAINKKLENTKVTDSEGESVAASTMITASLGDDGVITFNGANGNNVKINDATGKLKETFGVDTTEETNTLDTTGKALYDDTTAMGDYLSGKTLSMTVDGKTKTITLPTYDRTSPDAQNEFVAGLDASIKKAFGSSVSAAITDGKLQITGQKGSTISINTTAAVGAALGLGGAGAASYFDTSATLASVLGKTDANDDTGETLGGIAGKALKSQGKITKNESSGEYYDEAGNLTDEAGNRLGQDGKQLYGYEMEINGAKISVTRDTAVESVLTQINSNSDMGFKATFSKTTNTFQFTAQETGEASGLEINETLGDGTTGNLAAKLFGVVTTAPDGAITGKITNADGTETEVGSGTAGQNAILTMEVNGTAYENIQRGDNTFDVDGLSVTLKDTFGYTAKDADGKDVPMDEVQAGTEAVTFSTTSDADKIVEAVKSMVEDMNKIMTGVHDAFSTVPERDNKGNLYDPLTSEDQEGMNETQIKNYEEKAKTGLLFADRDLNSMYSKLLDAIAPSGASGNALRAIGISTDYSSGVTNIKLDEDALRNALSNDPDAVQEAFTSTGGSGGLMYNINKVLDEYTATTGASKGILIEKAGSSYSALSMLDNTILNQIDELDKQIDTWQSKMSDKIDYYTQQFTRLEQLTQQMNSQSSTLMGMMGG